MPEPTSLLATGFIADTAAEGSFIPTLLADSASPNVQAVYWRCIACFYFSARLNNPQQRLALFTNVTPPSVDGVDIAALLDQIGVELHLLPLTARLPADKAKSWGNVLYFYDIMEHLSASEDPALRFALVDSDILVTDSLTPLFALLDEAEFGGYRVEETRPDEDVNGLTPAAMGAIARAMGSKVSGAVEHLGGELFIATPPAWRDNREAVRAMLDQAMAGEGEASAVRTEEHIYSIIAAMHAGKWAKANGLIKRMWTSIYFNNVRPGDEALPVWHLPAEKRYGLRDLFFELKGRGFSMKISPVEFRELAKTCCGIPRKSVAKRFRDGVRQVAGKLGLRP
ncbi:hypothetical protein [Novosphingobium sp. TH158]|uniref:hypothetical protein n=1 Tax=Novosphingobium sp. TH158 TaxID=2067455 RepID=UPI000C7E5149|nr:hypothetical protein [Novosphingobium sp. TH158]PLK27385.1 hypothetical protein C0V78_11175 [Novosphingobium sp. TH158]